MTDKERIEKAAHAFAKHEDFKGQQVEIKYGYIAGATAEQPIIEDLKQQLASVTKERDRLQSELSSAKEALTKLESSRDEFFGSKLRVIETQQSLLDRMAEYLGQFTFSHQVEQERKNILTSYNSLKK